MPTDEFVRWCAFFEMRTPSGGGGGGGKIGKFKAKLSSMGFYKGKGQGY